ncbi:MAG: glycoside hydrolase family 99-like domain-containing protein [Candidatus Competibacteraceae bacterium]|nr:glycoside hydrolase family 99-like domain-containing protein [Candidatus Competibacteraceae bacterium]
MRYPFVDYSIWKNTPAAIQANKTRTNASLLKTEVEKQIEFIEKEIKKTPEEDTIRRYDLICQIGYLLKQDNQSKNALAKFNQAIALDDMDPKAYGAYADILIANGQEIEAEAWLRKALKHLPEQPQLLSRLDKLLSTRRIKSVQIIAFYLPQFHPIPENDQWWGKGFTEWANVTAAVPLFHGHLQPRRPTALGYYDLRLPEIANAQFDLAKRYGIDAFCYYYYWFDGKRVLDRPLQDLVDGKTGPFPFCICWANEDWTRSWDGQSGEVLLAQNHSPESDFRFIQDIAPLLRHANYVRFDGKPILLIYRPDKLAEPQKRLGRGAIGAVKKALAIFIFARCNRLVLTIRVH